MKKFSVHLDVTLSGWDEVEANSEEEARRIIENRTYQHYDCQDFYYFSKEIVDVEEVDSDENADFRITDYCYHCGCEIEEGRSRQDKDENIICEDCLIQQQAEDLGLVK
jgi:hypothetical protein